MCGVCVLCVCMGCLGSAIYLNIIAGDKTSAIPTELTSKTCALPTELTSFTNWIFFPFEKLRSDPSFSDEFAQRK